MATHSSVLAWRIPGMEEPGRLPCMGSQSRTQLKWLSSSSSSSSRLFFILLMVSLPVRPQGWSIYYIAETTHSSGGSPSLWRLLPLLCPFWGAGVHPDHFSSLPTWLHVTLHFTSWVHTSPSSSLQCVFSENRSTRRCIFDRFMGGGELCVVLLHHLISSSFYFLITTCFSCFHLWSQSFHMPPYFLMF